MIDCAIGNISLGKPSSPTGAGAAIRNEVARPETTEQAETPQ